MTDTIIFKDLREYIDFLSDVVNVKQPTLERLELQELEDGRLEVKLIFAPVE